MANVQFGRYRLERPLAQGGMAEIFLARQSGPEGFEKLVVIKRVLPRLASEASFEQMFLDEARIAARLDHPGIAQVFDFGQTDGRYYIAMEYLAGEDFAELLKGELARHNTVPPPIAARLLSAACDALHYAHTFVDESGRCLNIVHRDISPSNLLLTYSGAVKVLDFGLAKAEGKKAQTMDGQLKGKLLYMSPEQIHGGQLDARSDVFALGAVLHELLAGQPTFLRNEPVLIVRAISEEPIIPLSDLVPGISPDLEQIAAKALEKDPARRFQSALEMRQALDAYLATVGPGSPTAQLQDYVRGLVPAEQIQRKTRPLATSAPPHSTRDADVEIAHAPTCRRMAAVSEDSAPRLVSPTPEPGLAPDSTYRELAPFRIAEESVDQDGATVLEAPAFQRDQVVVPAPKPSLLRAGRAPTPKASDKGPSAGGARDVGGLEIEPEISKTPTRPSQTSMPQLKSEAGPRSWPVISAADTARGETLSPLAAAKKTRILEAFSDEPPRAGLLAALGLRTTRDLVLAGVGLALLAAAAAVLVWGF